MRPISIGVLALAVLMLASGRVLAQRGQGRGFGGGGFGPGKLMLLSQESVQKELKLSDDQIKKVDEQLAKQREAMAGLRDLDQQERRAKLQEQLKANDTAVAGILNEAQARRLKQIALQQRGAAALVDSEVAQAVGLTSEQTEKIQSIQQAAQEERRALFQAGGSGDREQMRKKFEAARAATNEKILALLTTEQKEKWGALNGEPFKGEIRATPFRRGTRPSGAGTAHRRDAIAATSPNVLRFAAFGQTEADTNEAADEGASKRPDAAPSPPADRRADRSDGSRGRHGRHAHHRPGRHNYADRPHFARGRGDGHAAWNGPRFAGPDGRHGRFARDQFAERRPPQGGFRRGPNGPRHVMDGPHAFARSPHGLDERPHHHFASWRGWRDERFSPPPPRRGDDRPYRSFLDRQHHRELNGPSYRRAANASEKISQLQRQLDVITRELAMLKHDLEAR